MLQGIQSALDPHGLDARVIGDLTWVLFVGGAIVFGLVMLLAAWAAFGRRRAWLGSHASVVGWGVALPAAVLFALLAYTLVAATRMAAAHGEPELRIDVRGEQWWWRVSYRDAQGGIDFATANEIRIPVGRTVELALSSADVLHSLWVPALAGKLDMIPGKDNRMRLLAERPGVFRGQCAEYCGGPHAQMALYVVAEPDERFEQWRRAQREPATAATNALFQARCAVCHAVRGTPAAGTLGPDLTHVGSRRSIGAGILPNDADSIARWISSAQHLKPGNLMPEFREFDAAELRALAAYVESLK